jgi:hypothetical protein
MIKVTGQPHAQAAFFPKEENLGPIEYEVSLAPEPAWTSWRRGASVAAARMETPRQYIKRNVTKLSK